MTNLPVNPVPEMPTQRPPTPRADFKPATPDLIEFDDSQVPIDFMTDVLFEQVGGQEMISISRNDLINGQSVLYNPIRNVTQLNVKYGPSTIIPMPDTIDFYFNGKAIKLSDKLPEAGETVYLDKTRGDIVIEVNNMTVSERVEIEILFAPNPVDGIIWSED
jgi:hypothetical protein